MSIGFFFQRRNILLKFNTNLNERIKIHKFMMNEENDNLSYTKYTDRLLKSLQKLLQVKKSNY